MATINKIKINGVEYTLGGAGGGGVSPTIEVTAIAGGTRLTIKDVTGTKTVNIMNGTNYVLTDADKREIVQMVLAELANDTYFYYDDADMRWYDNSDGTYGGAGTFQLEAPCPHCGTILQSSYSFDAEPLETNCPHCTGDIVLVDGTVHERQI